MRRLKIYRTNDNSLSNYTIDGNDREADFITVINLLLPGQ